MIRSIKYLVSVFTAFLMLGSFAAKAEIVVASAGPMSGQYASFGARFLVLVLLWPSFQIVLTSRFVTYLIHLPLSGDFVLANVSEAQQRAKV